MGIVRPGDGSGQTKDIAADHTEIVKQLNAEYDRWWAGAVPNMVNETAAATAAKLKFTPYKVLYWNQFRGPGPNNVPVPEGLNLQNNRARKSPGASSPWAYLFRLATD